MQQVLILCLIIFAISSNGQNIVGLYKYEYKRESDQKTVTLEINILNDSIFNVNGYEENKPDKQKYQQSERLGKISKLKNRRYLFTQYDNVAKKYFDQPVKITQSKIIFYGYKQSKSGKVSKKLVKAFELKKLAFNK
jgi:hypothetical protein